MCELLAHFPGGPRELVLDYPDRFPNRVVVPWRSRIAALGGTELHHICGSGNGAKRVDVPTNMIMVCKPIHRWLECYKPAGLVVCCYRKWLDNVLDWGELESIKGKCMPSWLETDQVSDQCKLFPWVEDMRWSLIRES